MNKDKSNREYEFKAIKIIDGIKVLTPIKEGRSTKTPTYAYSSKYYATHNSRTGEVNKFSCYDEESGVKIKDVDWGHDHGPYKKGEPHVHYYENGVKIVDKTDNKLSSKEWQIYMTLKGVNVYD